MQVTSRHPVLAGLNAKGYSTYIMQIVALQLSMSGHYVHQILSEDDCDEQGGRLYLVTHHNAQGSQGSRDADHGNADDLCGLCDEDESLQ